MKKDFKNNLAVIAFICALICVVHLIDYEASEPFYNGDETRHVMTGMYFKDILTDLPLNDLIDYTINYYIQYPALGIIIWPPFFYFLEGIFFLFLGSSFLVSKILIIIFTCIGSLYLFLLVRETHEIVTALTSVLIFVFSPMVFQLSRYVMLEMPTLAWSLAAIYYFIRYLKYNRPHYIYLTAVVSAFACLTRFDGIYLFVAFILLLVFQKKISFMWNRDFILSGFILLILIAPFYLATALNVGSVQTASIINSSGKIETIFNTPRLIFFYIYCIPKQIGWIPTILAMLGFGLSMKAKYRQNSIVFYSIIFATYITFTLLAEFEDRHVIYWIPAFSFFSVMGINHITVGMNLLKIRFLLILLVIGSNAAICFSAPGLFVRGYANAAQYIISNSEKSKLCLFDGEYDGNFIFQMRRLDKERKFWILRGDKLFYSSICYPLNRYKEHVVSDNEILKLIEKYDPEYFIVEEPRPYPVPPLAEKLRSVLKSYPDRFILEKVIPIESNLLRMNGVNLNIYRNLNINLNSEKQIEFEMLMLGKSINAIIP